MPKICNFRLKRRPPSYQTGTRQVRATHPWVAPCTDFGFAWPLPLPQFTGMVDLYSMPGMAADYATSVF